MSNIKLSNRTLFVALACAAIALFQSFPSAAHKLAAPLAADLTAEKQALSSFGTGLTNLETKVAELQKRSSISSTELNSVKTTASTLKTKVSPIGQTFQSVINKLKTSGEWENFDNSVLGRRVLLGGEAADGAPVAEMASERVGDVEQRSSYVLEFDGNALVAGLLDQVVEVDRVA